MLTVDFLQQFSKAKNCEMKVKSQVTWYLIVLRHNTILLTSYTLDLVSENWASKSDQVLVNKDKVDDSFKRLLKYTLYKLYYDICNN